MIDLISAGANRIPQPAGKLGNSIVYAAQNLLLVWGPSGVTKSFDLGSWVTSVVGQGEFVVAGTQDGAVYVLGEKLNQVHTAEKSITCLALDNYDLAVGSSDGSIRTFVVEQDLSAVNETANFKINARFYALALAIKSGVLAIAGTSGSVFIRTAEGLIEMPGHENWVRSLDFYADGEDLVLASGSQDRYIRLWRLSPKGVPATSPTTSLLSTKVYTVGKYSAVFEALLVGHDDWVVSVQWNQDDNRLLSASSDSSLIVWAPGDASTHFSSDEGDDLWTPQIRLGDISIMGASTATGASGGFWTALWLDKHVGTVSKTGSWRLWTKDTWDPVPGISGHTKVVTDLAWFGEYLLTTSLDQTTRLWAQVSSEVENKEGLNANSKSYYELSRPQIHGYDMITVASIDSNRFISAGDEKTLRVFTKPKPVSELLSCLTDATVAVEELPAAASVPALGLSNKSLDDEDETLLDTNKIPREDHLQRLTLWPEVEKLYGHGYEMSCVDVSPTKEFVATCCKANNAKHAVVRIYTTDNWRQIEPLEAHSLTVTRVRFSPDGEHLLTVSRDRQWTLFNMKLMNISKAYPKAHTRIIWDCAWIDNTRFVTVSREKTLKCWSIEGQLLHTVDFESPATAVDAYDDMIAVGLENGAVHLLRDFAKQDSVLHGDGRINRLLFNGNKLAIASNTVRIYEL